MHIAFFKCSIRRSLVSDKLCVLHDLLAVVANVQPNK